MLELGTEEERWHRDLAAPLLAAGPAGILLFGPRMRWLMDELKRRGYQGNLSHFDTHAALADFLKVLLNHGDLVLLKGSRGMRMEHVLEALLPAQATILNPAKDGLAPAAQLLLAGDVVGMPTETVYGLAGNALDEKALTRIFSTKERPTFDPLIVHITPELLDRALPDGALLDALETLGLAAPDALTDLARASIETLTSEFWPGPLTLVLPKGPRIPDLVCAGLAHVALRMPAHPVARALINEAGLPVAAPSANRFGRISPTSARAVQQELGDRIPMIVDGGECDIGVESTVLAITPSGEPVMLRPGGISREAISEILGIEVLSPAASAATEAAPQAAPGMLESHYAPRKPLTLLPTPLALLAPSEFQRLTGGRKAGILLQSGIAPAIPNAVTLSLSPAGDRAEAARNLFRMLRELDSSEAEILFAEPVASREGLDHAIGDRLAKAAAPRK
jgi:L-threonylcarbamoyladenylate synthase